MREYQRRRKVKSITTSIWFLASLLFITLIIFSSVFGLYQKKKQVLKLNTESMAELNGLNQKTESINRESKILDTAHGQEKLIREKYNVKSEGEQVIVVMDQDKKIEGIKAVKTDIWYSVKNFFTSMFD